MHTASMMDYTFPGYSFGFMPGRPPDLGQALSFDTLRRTCASQSAADVKNLSRLDWERVRPIITELYIQQDLPLKTLAELMQSVGFLASEQMYKKKFKLWDLRKNYTRQQRAQIFERLLQSDRQTELEASLIEINSQPLKLQRIKRYLSRPGHAENRALRRRRGLDTTRPVHESALETSSEDMTSPPIFASGKSVTGQMTEKGRGSSSGSLTVVYPQPSDHINALLLNVDSYFTFYFSWNKIEQPYGFCKEMADVFNVASSARRALLERNTSRSSALIQEATSSVESLIRQQPLQLIEEIFRRFSHPGWSSTPHIKMTVLEQIARKANHILGTGHPLSVITVLVLDPSTMKDGASATFRAISESALQKLERGDEDHFAVQQDIADCLSSIDDLDDAETICQRSLAQAEPIFRPAHWILRNIKRDLGQVRFKQGDWREAERLWLEVYELTIHDKGQANLGSNGLATCECLASMYRTRGRGGDLKSSAHYYRLALEGALRAWGPQNVDVVAYFDSLAGVLEQDGEIEQWMELYSEYAFLVEEIRRKEARESKL